MAPPKTKIHLLHHKEREWADYIRTYSSLGGMEKQGLIEVVVDSLPQQNAHKSFARLPEKVRRLLFFAKPDLVVTIDDGRKPVAPIFALDATEHVAARDHWIQRFPNLVGCAQESVPGAFVAPRDMPNRENFEGRTDPFFFFAYDRVMEVHQSPIYIAEWPSTDGATLDGDQKWPDLPPHTSPGMQRTLGFFDLVLESALKGGDLRSLSRDRVIVDLRHDLRASAYKSIPKISDFERLKANMPQDRPLTKQELEAWLNARNLALPKLLPDRIMKRDRNLVLSPVLDKGDVEKRRTRLKNRIHLKGGDPYTQQPLVFDYLFCRLGPTPVERDTNLVIDLTLLHFEDFADYVADTWKSSPLGKRSLAEIGDDLPTYTLHLREGIGQVVKNFVRLYAWAADMIVFRDGVVYF